MTADDMHNLFAWLKLKYQEYIMKTSLP